MLGYLLSFTAFLPGMGEKNRCISHINTYHWDTALKYI